MPQVKEELKFDVKQEAENKDRKAMVEQSTSENLKKDPPCSSEDRVEKEEKGPSSSRVVVKHEIMNESKASVSPSDPEQSATVVEALEEEVAVYLALPAAYAEAPKPSQRSSRNERKDRTTGASAQGSSQKVTAKREACPKVLTAPGVNHPALAGTKVGESVTVRQESPAPQQLSPEEQEAKEQLWRSKISKKVKSENLRFDLNVLWSRLVTAKIPPDLFPITLDREIRDVCVSRVFLSKTWGGGFVATFPTIGAEKLDQHGLDDFMFPGPDTQPGVPEVPGAPGLWLDVDDHEGTWWGKHNLDGDKPTRLFTRIVSKPALWQYQGQYRIRAAQTLTADEWRQQKAEVRNAWAEQMSAGKMKKDMTKEEIQLGMTRGDVKMGVYTMECVAYDEDFQRQVAEKWANWVRPQTAKKRKALSQLSATRKKKKTVEKGKGKGEHYSGEEEETSDIEGEGDSEDKGRPRLV
ncbi:hypothetical protein BKA70DRAFT_282133 [Coprinopsis sp. MPI-PUGE-AT-0042]|nr:hypothetical protein BKA70DRAFT_282133 [Coprinopsis sp. MPI-PUGE-AT-0042]